MGSRAVPIWVRPVAIMTIVVAVLAARRFFFGKLLDVEDFTEEQEYRRCRRRCQ